MLERKRRCSGGHGFDSRRHGNRILAETLMGESDLFFAPRSCHVDQFTFHISLLSIKLRILSNLSLTYKLTFILFCFCSTCKENVRFMLSWFPLMKQI